MEQQPAPIKRTRRTPAELAAAGYTPNAATLRDREKKQEETDYLRQLTHAQREKERKWQELLALLTRIRKANRAKLVVSNEPG